jgi:soluble epoxide hydrolase / lipid-phosphate phosphatase
MDSSLYKDLVVSRGLKYHYYYSPPTDGKPCILFLHGFPSTSRDWRFQVPYFKELGYGLIVPDMPGYGGTSKPLDPSELLPSKVTKDLVEILDAESAEKVVAIGHDWYVSSCLEFSRDGDGVFQGSNL